MIDFFVECVESIIIAIIFVIIIEMLLPNGSNKKYIKMVSGIYLMFTILNPFLELFNKDISLDLFENIDSIETSSNISEDYLKNYYTESFKTAIKADLKELGYDIDEIVLELDDTNSEIIKIRIRGAKENEFENIKSILVESYGITYGNISFS
ncbi:MAG: stage III sporulation protein AF [Clostridia bacterium]|nr:stage III sporulation protein AF [Clostridia bacterium]